ncbi:MAG TPA: PEGA domain-containing protein [Bacteroidota bacterium]|nr:PEGA domain-containing protein [Bacteroidota bacterium]
MKKLLNIVSLFVCFVARAQTVPAPDSAVVSILTEPPHADVYIDSVYAGKSPLSAVRVPTGRHILRTFYPSVFSWNAVVTLDTLNVNASSAIERTLHLGESLRIESDPPGSSVRYLDQDLGVTPLYVRLQSPIADGIIIQKAGYDSLLVPASQIQHDLLRVQLAPNAGDRLPDVLGLNGRSSKDYRMVYASGSAMIVSGVVSAFLKDRANRHFDAYLQNSNPSDLSTTRTLDRAAAATLILSQISLGVLAYLLLAE